MHRNRNNPEADRGEPDTEELINQDIDDILNRTVEDASPSEEPLEKDLRQLEEEHRAKMLHLETLTMMAKYQILFLKMENRIKSLGRMFSKKVLEHKAIFMEKLASRCIRQRGSKQFALRFAAGVTALSRATRTACLLKLLGAGFNRIRKAASLQSVFSEENEKIVRLERALEKAKTGKKLLKKRSAVLQLEESNSKDKSAAVKTRSRLQVELDTALRARRLQNKKLKSSVVTFQDKVLKFLADVSQLMAQIQQHK